MSASNGRKLKEFSGMREDWKLFKRRYTEDTRRYTMANTRNMTAFLDRRRATE